MSKQTYILIGVLFYMVANGSFSYGLNEECLSLYGALEEKVLEPIRHAKAKYSSDGRSQRSGNLLQYLKYPKKVTNDDSPPPLKLVSEHKLPDNKSLYQDDSGRTYLLENMEPMNLVEIYEKFGETTRYRFTGVEPDRIKFDIGEFPPTKPTSDHAGRALELATLLKNRWGDQNKRKIEKLLNPELEHALLAGVRFEADGKSAILQMAKWKGKPVFAIHREKYLDNALVRDEWGSSIELSKKDWAEHGDKLTGKEGTFAKIKDPQEHYQQIKEAQNKQERFNFLPVLALIKGGKVLFYPTTAPVGIIKGIVQGARHRSKIPRSIKAVLYYLRNDGIALLVYLLMEATDTNPVTNYVEDQEGEGADYIFESLFQKRTDMAKLGADDKIAVLEGFASWDSLDGMAKTALDQTFSRFENAQVIDVNSLKDAAQKLNNDVQSNGKKFGRVEFNQHGKGIPVGIIWDDLGLRPKFQSTHQLVFAEEYVGTPEVEKLEIKECPIEPGGQLVLNACQPAQGEEGTRFLEALGKKFLKDGGSVYGSTKLIMVDRHLLPKDSPRYRGPIKQAAIDLGGKVAMPFRLFTSGLKDLTNPDPKEPTVKVVVIPPQSQ